MAITLVWKDDAGANVIMQFDLCRQEAHDLITVVTEHPVEVGADIADHVRDELDQVTIEGYVTDTPTNANNIRDEVFGRLQNVGTIKTVELQIPEKPLLLGVSTLIGAGIGALGDALFGTSTPKANILTFDDFKSRKKIIAELLDGARRSHRKIRILTDLYEYDDMLITQLNPTRSPDDGSGATFTVTLREIRTVESELVIAPAPAEALGASQVSAGSKSAKKDKELEAEKSESALHKLGGFGQKYVQAYLSGDYSDLPDVPGLP